MKKKGSKPDIVSTKRKKISPFRNVAELEKEITEFMNIHKATFHNHASRISDYFEMCCFNYVVRFYDTKGFKTSIENLQDNKYRYKCTTQGNQENFSHFCIARIESGQTFEFEIHHNLAVQSFYGSDIYTTPDITIIRRNSIESDKDFYSGNKNLSYTSNKNLVTFCEVKHYNPFPELIFNFIGTINELHPSLLTGSYDSLKPPHIAPSLMISGKPNIHANKIKKSLESRYCVNIIFDLFSSTYHPFTKSRIGELKTIKKKVLASDIDELEF